MGADYKHTVQWREQPVAVIDQAAPNINQWYPVLAPTVVYTRLFDIIAYVMAVGETLEVEVTINGLTWITPGVACGAGVVFRIIVSPSIASEITLQAWSQNVPYIDQYGHNVGVRVRKTTAAGAGNLRCKVVFELD